MPKRGRMIFSFYFFHVACCLFLVFLAYHIDLYHSHKRTLASEHHDTSVKTLLNLLLVHVAPGAPTCLSNILYAFYSPLNHGTVDRLRQGEEPVVMTCSYYTGRFLVSAIGEERIWRGPLLTGQTGHNSRWKCLSTSDTRDLLETIERLGFSQCMLHSTIVGTCGK